MYALIKSFFCTLVLTISLGMRDGGAVAPAFSVDVISHEYGLNISVSQSQLYNNASQWLFWSEITTAFLRAALLPLGQSLIKDNSSLAELKKAGISFVLLANEVLHILNHPSADHTIDAVWAITDTAQLFSHVAKAIAGLIKPSDKPLGVDPFSIEKIHKSWRESFDDPEMQSLAMAELCLTLATVVPCNNLQDRVADFSNRSILSMLRLVLAQHNASKYNGEQSIYWVLFSAQLVYTLAKLLTQQFNAPLRYVVPNPAHAVVVPPPPPPAPPVPQPAGPLQHGVNIALGNAPDAMGDLHLFVRVPRPGQPDLIMDNNHCPICVAGFNTLIPAPDLVHARVACMPCGHAYCAHEIRAWWNQHPWGQVMCMQGCHRPNGANNRDLFRALIRQYDVDPVAGTVTFVQNGL